MNIKEKIDKLNFIKMKNFCFLKIPLRKRKAREWKENICYTFVFKRLLSRICKERLQFNNKKTSNPVQNRKII